MSFPNHHIMFHFFVIIFFLFFFLFHFFNFLRFFRFFIFFFLFFNLSSFRAYRLITYLEIERLSLRLNFLKNCNFLLFDYFAVKICSCIRIILKSCTFWNFILIFIFFLIIIKFFFLINFFLIFFFCSFTDSFFCFHFMFLKLS